MIAPHAAHSSGDVFDRNRLICERRAFSSSVRFFALRGTCVGTRLAGRWFNCSIFLRSFCRQMALFRCWLRSCCEVTTILERGCLRRTPLSVLLTCCPPGPLERKVSTSHSRNRSSSDSGSMITVPSSYPTGTNRIEWYCLRGLREATEARQLGFGAREAWRERKAWGVGRLLQSSEWKEFYDSKYLEQVLVQYRTASGSDRIQRSTSDKTSNQGPVDYRIRSLPLAVLLGGDIVELRCFLTCRALTHSREPRSIAS
jgi:hypothetical protein